MILFLGKNDAAVAGIFPTAPANDLALVIHNPFFCSVDHITRIYLRGDIKTETYYRKANTAENKSQGQNSNEIVLIKH